MIAHPIDCGERLAFVDRLAGGPMTWPAPDGLVHRVAGTGVDAAEPGGPFLLFTACGRWDLPEAVIPTSGAGFVTCAACRTAAARVELSRTPH